MNRERNTAMNYAETTNFDDNNFLQDWLERRYGCGFAQMVVDEVKGAQPEACAMYHPSAGCGANDNSPHATKGRKAG